MSVDVVNDLDDIGCHDEAVLIDITGIFCILP
jgi:hypothetical protein